MFHLHQPRAYRSLGQLIDTILNQRSIDRDTQQLLMDALLDSNQLSRREQIQVRQIFDAITYGCLQVVD